MIKKIELMLPAAVLALAVAGQAFAQVQGKGQQ